MVGIFVEVLVRRSWKRVLCFISLHWESRANKAIPRVAIITCLRTASSGKFRCRNANLLCSTVAPDTHPVTVSERGLRPPRTASYLSRYGVAVLVLTIIV
eukprot:3291677-Rhodomonas_salina.3